MSDRQVPPQEWHEAVQAAREEGFAFFDWISAVDQTDAEADPGLEVVCRLARPEPWTALMLSTRVPAGAALSSITDLFSGAAWHEREMHEMFGLALDGFTDGSGQGLRPLLLPDGFEGTPLRKDFVLAARASKPWPGAKEPGESDATSPRATSRRRLLPPGVPDPSWGPR